MLVLHIEKVWKSFRSEHLDKVGELGKLPDMRVSWAVLHHMVLILEVPKVAGPASAGIRGEGMDAGPEANISHAETVQCVN